MFNALKSVGLRREEEVKIDMSWKGIDVTKNVTVLTENFPK